MKDRCSSHHKYTGIYQPGCNCKACWFTYFQKHPGIFSASITAVKKLGEEAVTRIKGKKFMKFLKVFIAERSVYVNPAQSS